MRRLLVLVSFVVGLQACTRSTEAPLAVAGEEVVAGIGTSVFPPPSVPQTGYAVAFDGASYLVVWTDTRGTTGADVYAARVSAAGVLLDTGPIVVSAAPGDQVLPEVAFDGTNYLVVWQDHRLSGDRNIHAARITPAGGVLDPGSIAIAQPGQQVNPDVAFDGATYLVVWEDQRDVSSDVRGARVTAEGAVLDAGLVLSAAAGHQVQPAVGCGPKPADAAAATCLAAWRDQRLAGPDVWGTRVTAGAVLDPLGVAISRASSSQGVPAVAGDGARFLVAWNDTRNGTSDVYGARVALDGAVLDPAGVAISTAPGTQTAAAIAFEGAYHLVLWEDGRSGTGYDVYGARVDAAGAVLDPGGFVVEPGTAGARVALASDGAGRSLVASDRREIVDPILGTAVSRLSARILVSRAKLSVARTGSGSGTVASVPAGIDCGELCSAFFDAPTDVNLTPTAAPGSAFVSWSGACSGAGPCTLTMDDTRSVIAKFSLLYPLTVALTGTAGSVVSTPAGIDCGAACTAEYVEDTLVELTPVAGTNSLFKAWSAPCAETVLLHDPLWLLRDPTCRVPMTQAWAVTAEFGEAYSLTVNATGTADGRVDAADYWPIHCATGSTQGCSSMVPADTAVKLVAAPAPDAILKQWSGCASVEALECTVTVTGTKTVTATFQPSTYLLTAVAGGTGGGTVTGPGIDCRTGFPVSIHASDCTQAVPNGGEVTLEATPDADSVFKYWSGCPSADGNACTVTMTAAKTVTAVFQPAFYSLTVNPSGGGSGTVSSVAPGLTCTVLTGVPCSGTFANGETVVLTASPDGESVLKYWSGCNEVSEGTCTVVMTGTKNLTLRMEPSTYPLTVVPSGTGAGSISGPGISCGPGTADDCTEATANGATVTLTAVPDASSILKYWSGCAEVDGTACIVNMTQAKTVTATFQPAFYPLTINPSGGGAGTVTAPTGFTCSAVTGVPCSGTFANGETVELTVTPDASSVFKYWSSCNAISETTCQVVMTGAKNLTLRLEPSTYPLTVVASGTAPGSVTGAGIACGAGTVGDCTEAVANGENVTLTAVPGASAILKSWSGCAEVDGTTCIVAMTLARTVTATFQPATYPLTINPSGGGVATVTSPSGFTCTATSGVPCSGTFANGETVEFTATPDASSVFKYWSGCSSVDGTTCTIVMTGAKNLTLRVEPSTYPLTVVVSGTAPGSVTGPGIACGAGTAGDCTEAVANGDTVALTATPGANAIFKSWAGCTSVSENVCTVTPTAAKTVTATFQPATYPLTINPSGGGGATVTSPSGFTCTAASGVPCSGTFANGETVEFTATPNASSIFKYWSGCASISGTTCTVVMTGAKNLTLRVEPSTYPLTVVVSGTGAGAVTGDGIACGAGTAGDCTEAVANGGIVTLTATPDASSILKSWSGCASVSGHTCSVTLTAARTVTANFQPATYPLTTVTGGTGSGTITGPGIACATGSTGDCTEAVANGATVSLTATPEAGSIFKYWSGCTALSGDVCSVTMTLARTVTAYFQPSTYLLSVNISGAGTVAGGPILCSAGSAEGCSAAIANGESVTLTATPAAGAIFRGWSGCSTVSGTTCNVAMTLARTVTAYF